MARRSEHTLAEIKEMTLSAAESIVTEKGISALTMRKIAWKMGYTVGSIYMVFTGMADLIMQINARTLDEITNQMDAVPATPPAQAIENLAKIYLHFANLNFNRWSIVFEYRLPQDTKAPDYYQEKIDNIHARIHSQLALLTSGRDGRQNNQAARALWAGVHGICILSLTEKNDIADIEERIVLLVRNFIRGWLTSADF